jgi:hypothetical protein
LTNDWGKKKVLPANHLPLLRNRKIEKEKANVEQL